jgi:hypothetical protein
MKKEFKEIQEKIKGIVEEVDEEGVAKQILTMPDEDIAEQLLDNCIGMIENGNFRPFVSGVLEENGNNKPFFSFFPNGDKDEVRAGLFQHLAKQRTLKYTLAFDTKMTEMTNKVVLDTIMITIYTPKDKYTYAMPYELKKGKVVLLNKSKMVVKEKGRKGVKDLWDLWSIEDENSEKSKKFDNDYNKFKRENPEKYK